MPHRSRIFRNGGILLNHPNWLDTEQYRSTPTGTQYEVCVNNPFGDNLSCPEANGDLSPVHFTGKERDWWLELAPANLDNFGARFYSSSTGGWPRFRTRRCGCPMLAF